MVSDVIAQPQHEQEGTHFPGGVLVTDTEIITHTEVIPRFGANPTITATRSGSWSDPGVWAEGRVPTDFDVVMIPQHVVLSYSMVGLAALSAVEVNGGLIFSTSVNTRMRVGTLTVMPTGTLQIGTAATPVASGVKAEITILDTPIDLESDPRQYGTGLLVLGTVNLHGADMSQTWSRLTFEPRAGNGALDVEPGAAANWRVGDTLVIPDTRQYLTTDTTKFEYNQLAPQWEEVTITKIVGNRVYLSKPLQYDHLGARNSLGQLELLPHVANLTRNVVIRSENPNGVRGHTFYTARADVDIEFVRFQGLGRTNALSNLDSTRFDSQGNVTHYGLNQVGRYAVHLHHLMGPENSTNSGYQFKFVGNTIDNSRKWAVAVHDSSWGLIDRNVAYNAQGAGFVTEDGTEVYNQFSNNIAIRMQGTHVDGKEGTEAGDYGRGGSGFWFRRGGNIVVNNVSADNTYAGFVIDSYFNLDLLMLPAFRGAEKHEPGQGIMVMQNPTGIFYGNEAYGMSTYGFWAAYISGNNLIDGGDPTTTISNLRLWNITHTGVVAYHTNRLIFDRLLILGNQVAQDRNHDGTRGMDFQTYENRNLVIRNSRIEGVRYGIMAPRNDGSRPGVEMPSVVQDSYLRNYINILVSPGEAEKYSNGNYLTVRNVKFDLNTKLPNGPMPVESLAPPAIIQMRWSDHDTDYTMPSVVRVYNYNQVPGDDFQVFYREQASTNIMPKTDPQLLYGKGTGIVGAPVAGLTNAQAWASYALATAGGLLPSGASASRSTINGMIAAIQPAAAVPKLVLVNPWTNAQVPGIDPLRVRFNINGKLPVGASVYSSLDNQAAVARAKSFNLYYLSPGAHTLQLYIGDATGKQIPGTNIVTSIFTILPQAAPAAALAEAGATAAALDLSSAITLSATSAGVADDLDLLATDVATYRQAVASA